MSSNVAGTVTDAESYEVDALYYQLCSTDKTNSSGPGISESTGRTDQV
jgi:hypothetical protein